MLDHVACPFCGEDDFDLLGLKYHLQVYCEEYAALQEPVVQQEPDDVSRSR